MVQESLTAEAFSILLAHGKIQPLKPDGFYTMSALNPHVFEPWITEIPSHLNTAQTVQYYGLVTSRAISWHTSYCTSLIPSSPKPSSAPPDELQMFISLRSHIEQSVQTLIRDTTNTLSKDEEITKEFMDEHGNRIMAEVGLSLEMQADVMGCRLQDGWYEDFMKEYCIERGIDEEKNGLGFGDYVCAVMGKRRMALLLLSNRVVAHRDQLDVFGEGKGGSFWGCEPEI